MQCVNMKVPVSKCIELAAFSVRMFSKFPGNAVLVALAAGLQAASDDLWNAQSAYEGSLRAIIPTLSQTKDPITSWKQENQFALTSRVSFPEMRPI